jgi:hypothetical protein
MEKTIDNKPKSDEIAKLAYLAWEKAGKPAGQDMAFWLKAEQQLQATGKPAAAQATPSSKAPSRTAAGKSAFVR